MRLVELGVIGKPHGFRGEFVAHTDSGQASALETASQIYVGATETAAQPYQVVSASWMPKGWKIKLAGVESEDLVRALRGQSLFLNREELPPTEEGEFYLTDLVGSSVRDEDTGEEIGRCVGIENIPVVQQDRWHIERPNGETFSVPAVRRYVSRVDSQARVIWLRNLADLK